MKRAMCVVAAVAASFAGLGFRGIAAHAASLPAVTVGDASVVEGDSGFETVKVPIDLSTMPSSSVLVTYAIAADTAGAGDFAAKTGKLTFKTGQTDKQVSVKINGDSTLEGNEHVAVNVTGVSGASVGDGSGGVTILDDDANGAASGVEANIGDITVTEGDNGTHVADVPVTLNEPAPGPVTLSYGIDCATAIPGSDYTEKATGTITFNTKQQSKTVAVKIAADTTGEQVKKIFESVTVKSGSAHVNRGGGTVTIRDNDPLAPGDVEMDSVDPSGHEGNYPTNPIAECLGDMPAGQSSISGNGQFVAFESDADNLVADDTNGLTDIFVRDRYAGTTQRVSLKSDGSQVEATDVSGAAGLSPAISTDGRYVAFDSAAQLVPADTDNSFDTYLVDRTTGTIQLVSAAMGGGGSGSSISNGVDVSADGRYVAFSSTSTTLVASDTDPGAGSYAAGQWPDVFVRDMTAGTTTLVSDDAGGYGLSPAITPDGATVVYEGGLSLSNGTGTVYARDMGSGVVTIVGLTSTGAPAEAHLPAISADGSTVAFTGYGTVVATLPHPSVGHVYVRNLVAGTTELVDVAGSGLSADREPLGASLSADGRYVSFGCWCQRIDSGANAAMGHEGVYRRDRDLGVTAEVDVKANGTVADKDSRVMGNFHFMSDDGVLVVFGSSGTNLVPGDSNDHADIFVKNMS